MLVRTRHLEAFHVSLLHLFGSFAEQAMLTWIDVVTLFFCVRWGGSERRVSNFGEDLADGKCYLTLVKVSRLLSWRFRFDELCFFVHFPALFSARAVYTVMHKKNLLKKVSFNTGCEQKRAGRI